MRVEIPHCVLVVVIYLFLLHLPANFKGALLLAEVLSSLLFPRFGGFFSLLLHFFLPFNIVQNLLLALLVQLVLVIHHAHHPAGVERAHVWRAQS